MMPLRFVNRGLTLFELVLVLFILAIAATIAVQSLQPVADQARFDNTRETLSNIRNSTVEIVSNNDRTRSVTGFYADIGRLPTSIAEYTSNVNNLPESQMRPIGFGQDQGIFLNEPNSSDVPAYQVLSNLGFVCGWRGPYIFSTSDLNEDNIPDLVDGWGQAFSLSQASGLFDVVSNGAVNDQETYPEMRFPEGPIKTSQLSIPVTFTVSSANPADDLDPSNYEVQVFQISDGIPTRVYRCFHYSDNQPPDDVLLFENGNGLITSTLNLNLGRTIVLAFKRSTPTTSDNKRNPPELASPRDFVVQCFEIMGAESNIGIIISTSP